MRDRLEMVNPLPEVEDQEIFPTPIHQAPQGPKQGDSNPGFLVDTQIVACGVTSSSVPVVRWHLMCRTYPDYNNFRSKGG